MMSRRKKRPHSLAAVGRDVRRDDGIIPDDVSPTAVVLLTVGALAALWAISALYQTLRWTLGVIG